MCERHPKDRVAGLQQGHEYRHVRLRARVRLNVGVLGAEELLAALDRERFGDVDPFAPAVVPLSGIALGVLVGHHAAHRFPDRAARIVFRCDEFQILSLPPFFAGDCGKYLGILCLDPAERENIHYGSLLRYGAGRSSLGVCASLTSPRSKTLNVRARCASPNSKSCSVR